MAQIISIIMAFVAGALGSVQGTVNAAVSRTDGQYVMIAGVSLIQFLLSLAVVYIRGGPGLIQMASIGWMSLSAAMGVVIMFSVAYTVGGIGTMLAFILVIAGQILTSTVVSHFGWLGSPVTPISLPKLGSILLILIGVVCLVRSP